MTAGLGWGVDIHPPLPLTYINLSSFKLIKNERDIQHPAGLLALDRFWRCFRAVPEAVKRSRPQGSSPLADPVAGFRPLVVQVKPQLPAPPAPPTPVVTVWN